jgi:hypothetical protein
MDSLNVYFKSGTITPQPEAVNAYKDNERSVFNTRSQ